MNPMTRNARIAIRGGNWNNGVNTGAFNWNLNNGSGNSNRNIGTHLHIVDNGIKMTRCLRTRPASRQKSGSHATRAGSAPAGAYRTLGSTHKLEGCP